jgi:hypothetical protein
MKNGDALMWIGADGEVSEYRSTGRTLGPHKQMTGHRRSV